MAIDIGGAGGVDAAIVFNQRIDIPARRGERRLRRLHRAGIRHVAPAAGHRDAGIAAHWLKKDFIARGHHGCAIGRRDAARVLYRPADQNRIAIRRGDRACIDSIAVRGAAGGERATAHERAVGNIARGRDEAAVRHHFAARPDHNALRIDEIDRPRGGERTVDTREVLAGDAVQRGARTVVELNAVARTDGEALPINNAVTGRLVDCQGIGRTGDRALPRRVLPAGRQCSASQRGSARQRQRRAQQPLQYCCIIAIGSG